MNVLLDTNLVSETVKPLPHAGVMAWLTDVDEDSTFLSVITIAELRRGTSRMPDGAHRRRLEILLNDELPDRFYGRIVAVDETVALVWGDLMAKRDAAGRPFAPMDGFLAATCVVHDLALVTRNVADFEGSVERIINPWM